MLRPEVDLVVLGSGAGGLAAAVTAAAKGLTVAVFEKDAVLGGTTAWSGGWMWIPCSGVEQPPSDDSLDKVATYLASELGAAFARQKDKIDAYLKTGPEMVRFFEQLPNAEFHFETDPRQPDFHASAGSHAGRALRACSFDGRKLGKDIAWLRPPLYELTLWGMGIESGKELNYFFNASRSLYALGYVAWRLARYARDWLVYGRDMHLVNGNALVARLLAAAFQIECDACKPQTGHGAFERIGLFPSHPVRRLILDGNGRVCAAVVATPDGEREIFAKHGVVLACGGFPHDVERLRQCIAHAPNGYEHLSAAPICNTGDGLQMGEMAGGQVKPTQAAPAAWTPVSRYRRRDGSTAVYPHLVERAKPGVIAVNRAGQRFCDEAGAYHDVVKHWIDTSPADGPLHAWLICDRRFLWRYGLGAVSPRTPFTPLPVWALWTDYLKVSRTIEGLARACGIESSALRATVDRYNHFAPASDPDFQRGENPYDRYQGDARTQPNPCLAPIIHAPFFAVRLEPGSLGTFAGLESDAQGHVLRANGEPIPGLYACGNDMAPVMGGFYPSGGITVGAAMTFGYAVGKNVAGEPSKGPP